LNRIVDAFAAILGQRRGCEQQDQHTAGQNGCGFHFRFFVND